MQSDPRLAVAIVAGLDAREQQRLVAERAARLAGVIGFAEVGLRHRVLVLESKQRLARLGIRLRADARARLLAELDQQRPEQLDEAARQREAQLDPRAGGDQPAPAHPLPLLLA